MGHAHDRAVETTGGRLLQHRVQQGDERLSTLETESLLSEELGGEELLERLGPVELGQDVTLLVVVELDRGSFDLFLYPALLLGILDVHVLDADRAAVGVTQHMEDVTQGHAFGVAHPGVDALGSTGQELAVEVPDRQAVGGGIELGVHLGRLGCQRVQIRYQVAAHPIHVDQGRHLHLLCDLGGRPVPGIDVLTPLHRLVGNAEGREDPVVEVVLAEEQLVDLLEEHA